MATIFSTVELFWIKNDNFDVNLETKMGRMTRHVSIVIHGTQRAEW